MKGAKPRKKNKRKHIEIAPEKHLPETESEQNIFLTRPIAADDMTFCRNWALVASTRRLFEMLIIRLFLHPPHLERIFDLWNTAQVVFFQHENASIIFETMMKTITKSEFYPCLEISSKGFLFHPFGLSKEHKRFMLYMEGFDAFVTQVFSSIASAAEGSTNQDVVTGSVTLRFQYYMEAPGALWQKIRSFVCAAFVAHLIKKTPPEKRERVIEQMAECAKLSGLDSLATNIESFENTSFSSYCSKFIAQVF